MRSSLLLLAAIALIACSSKTPTPQTQAAKLYIAGAGLYQVTQQELEAAGWSLPSPNSETLARLHLLHRGKDIPVEVDGAGNSYAIRFYADPVYSDYTPTDVYWLTVQDTPAAAMHSRTVQPKTQTDPAPSFTGLLKLEQDKLYLSKGIGGAHWFWQSLTAPATTSVTITLPALSPGKAQLQVALAGETAGQHNVRVLMNGQLAGTAKWQGQAPYNFLANLPSVSKADNVITVDLPAAGDIVDVVLLDSVTLNYSKEFLAADDVLEFGGAQDYHLHGFGSQNISLYDISDPGDAERLQGFAVTAGNGDDTLTFHDDLQGRRYVAATTTAFEKPSDIRIAQTNNLLAGDQQADYLAIAPSEFANALQPLLQYRTAHGLKARFVDVEQIYDAFSYGVPDPQAIRDFLQYTLKHWAKPSPRFVLLAGKASYDYRDNLKGPNKNLVPTFLVQTPNLGDAASDDWFVTSSASDPRPALAIGRIPAKTSTELSTAVDKILQYSAEPADADWRRRAVFVTDKEDPSFDSIADRLAASLPKVITTNKVYLSANQGALDPTRAEIVRQWNAGALLMTYVGHGSIDTWAAGPLFSAENVPDLNNGNRLPILLTPTCLDGFFYHPQKDSLTEDLLFTKRGGIVAGFVPTGLSMPAAQDVLMNALLEQLFANPAPTLGEAITRAKRQIDTASPDNLEVLQTFLLLGDPALQWAPPK